MIEPKTTLSIDGSRLSNFEHVSLTQVINDHHTFEITVDDSIIESIGSHTLDKSKEWLGKPVVINFNEKEFLGVVTNVQLTHNNGYNGKLLVSGHSKTILLEGGEHVQSWLEKDLSSIVNDSVSAAGVDAAVAPVFTNVIEYQAQYQESHFQFIKRLAKQYNEWFYYDGLKLIFGKPTPEAAIPVEYGADINSINIAIQANANSYNTFSYNALDDKKNESATTDAVDGLNELGSFAFDKSKELFSIKPNGFSPARVKDKSEIDTMLKNKQGSAMAETNVLTATGHKQGLTVGSVIKVSSARYDNNAFDVKNYGEYIITEITHNATGVGGYSNNFKAISSGVAFLPEPEVTLPIAQPQEAAVISNTDPMKKGRVQVQFQWQKGDMKTSWLRVMTPDAGKSDKVGTNRGFVHIPEVDDQVMVGFRYNDPNRPFVMGSMFSGTTGAGGDVGNKMKKITTRSGSTIAFNDEDGSVTIVDADKNAMHYDGKGGVIVTANKTISLITGSSSLKMTSEGNINLSGVNVTITGTETITDNSASVTTNGSDIVSINSDSTVAINSANEASMTGTAKSTISSSGTTAVQGTIIKLN